MKNTIITNNDNQNIKMFISDFANRSSAIKIASAFFSEEKLITSWLYDLKKIDLLVSLRPPTNYYSLKNIYTDSSINIQFLGNNFHSKFFLFYKGEKPFAAILGSSNFTEGGLFKNIETNVLITETKSLLELEQQFSNLWEQSFLLQPTDLEKYKDIFDDFQEASRLAKRKQNKFEKNIYNQRSNRSSKTEVCKQAKNYLTFWRCIDEVKGIIENISKNEYPNIPVYLTIDHFWHWIKTVKEKEGRVLMTKNKNNTSLIRLFKQYCNWDKSFKNGTKEMDRMSKTIFCKYLSQKNIDNLTKENAKIIYSSLHSGAMRTKRFNADLSFIKENSIQRIRASLKYLLYSNDELDLRIHNLCKNPKYKLKELSFSGVQELIGWVSPDRYPIRNEKADYSLRALGYRIDE